MSTSVSEREAVATTTDPFPLPNGSFQLADLPQLTSDYLHSIQVRVTRVTDNLVSPQEGSFSVRVTNGAVRVTGWTLHLTSTNPDVAKIKASGTPLIIFREGGSSSVCSGFQGRKVLLMPHSPRQIHCSHWVLGRYGGGWGKPGRGSMRDGFLGS